jgi:hypothetical protein
VIRIAVLTPPLRMESVQRQFGAIRFENLKKEQNYESFRRWAGPNIVGNISNMTDFWDVLAKAHNEVEARFSHDMQVREYNGDMPVYLWLVDDKVRCFRFLIWRPKILRKHPSLPAMHD